LLEGYRLKKQRIERPGFLSALIRLSLAFFISNRIPLLTSSPVTEAFSHCLRNLILPRAMACPGVIFAPYGGGGGGGGRGGGGPPGAVPAVITAGLAGGKPVGECGGGERGVRTRKKVVRRVKRGGCKKSTIGRANTPKADGGREEEEEEEEEEAEEEEEEEGDGAETVASALGATFLQASQRRAHCAVHEEGSREHASGDELREACASSVPIISVKVSRAGGVAGENCLEGGVEDLAIRKEGADSCVSLDEPTGVSKDKRIASQRPFRRDANGASPLGRGSGVRGEVRGHTRTQAASTSWKKGYSSEKARFRALSAHVQHSADQEPDAGGKTEAENDLVFANFV